MDDQTYPVTRTDAEWRALLTPEQYAIMREHATERAGKLRAARTRSGPAHSPAPAAASRCSRRKTKFESGTGWPSFTEPVPGSIATTTDRSWGMVRTEVHCARCGSHLGHVFPDGPPPTGLRYCINGVATSFAPAE